MAKRGMPEFVGKVCIVGDSMLRGPEVARQFAPWADVHVHDGQEALTVKPPDAFVHVFYVSSGNAMCKKNAAAEAMSNIQSTAFDPAVVRGVILLGSPEFWSEKYGPQFPLLNRGFMDDAERALAESGIPVMRLCDEVIQNLSYTSDVHPTKGAARWELAEHVQKHLWNFGAASKADTLAHADVEQDAPDDTPKKRQKYSGYA